MELSAKPESSMKKWNFGKIANKLMILGTKKEGDFLHKNQFI
jgi:hypothetical protein